MPSLILIGALCFFSFAISAVEIAPDQLCRRVTAQVSQEINFQSLVAEGVAPQEAARIVQAHLTASALVQEGYQRRLKERGNQPISDRFLWEASVDSVLANLRTGEAGYFRAALARLRERGEKVSQDAANGERQFKELAALFNNPQKALRGPRTTPEEDYTIAMLAFNRLSKGDRANASHVMDLIQAAQDKDVAEALTAAGISPLELIRTILLHDLGKQYNDPHLAGYRAFLETVFPDPTKNYLSTRILPHEFGSMIILAELAKEAGIPEEKIPRLQALIAHHNAGYNPSLDGQHFWVSPYAWPPFAKKMQEAGIPLPEIYEAVLHRYQGGDKENVILTAFDRGSSLTLASQEKFSAFLVNTKNWTTEGLAKLIEGNADNVPREVDSVHARLKSYVGSEKAARVQSALAKYFGSQTKALRDLAAKLRKDAQEAPAPDGIAGTSIPYHGRVWYRVSSEGVAYAWNGKTWTALPSAAGEDIPSLFFRREVFPSLGYQPPVLQLPEVLRPK